MSLTVLFKMSFAVVFSTFEVVGKLLETGGIYQTI